MKLHLPLVLHVRDEALDAGVAEEDCYRILEESGVPRNFPMHRHCFNGNISKSEHDMRVQIMIKLIQATGNLLIAGCLNILAARLASQPW